MAGVDVAVRIGRTVVQNKLAARVLRQLWTHAAVSSERPHAKPFCFFSLACQS